MASRGSSSTASRRPSRRSGGSGSCHAPRSAPPSSDGSPARAWRVTTSRSITTNSPRGPPMEQQAPPDYSIQATASRADERIRGIKDGDSFAVFDHAGSIRPEGLGEQGVFHEGTRFLSRLELSFARVRPLLLNSHVRRDNVLVVALANADTPASPGGPLERDTIHGFSSSFLHEGVLHVRMRVHNFGTRALALEVAVLIAADFVDIFEIRGTRRAQRGRLLPPRVDGDRVVLGYEGLDQRPRATEVLFAPAPTQLAATHAIYLLDLPPGGDATLEVRAAFTGGARPPTLLDYEAASRQAAAATARRCEAHGALTTSSRHFDEWIDRS